jgi:type IV pilus assembly protein PilB
MAQLDISERRVPQDGRFKMRISKQQSIDFRVSSCPTLFGEKIVMRILDSSSSNLDIDKLGYEDFQKKLFMEAIHKPHGMVLVTGPTGSGKTVSLYTALNILNTMERNISTVEDPVEINLPGINQVNVNVKAGLTFAVALRAFLRQDPNIVMVGEIRDLETAEIAVKAAQTGHMVLSTLHTNSAPDTITRLMNMGIPSFNLATSISLVIAQRLARRLCPVCKEVINVPIESKIEMGFTEAEAKELVLYKAVGCGQCQDGYKGRVGLYEVMPISEQIAELIMKGGNAIDIAKQAQIEGVWNIRQSGLYKLRQGLTTFEEIYRISKE